MKTKVFISSTTEDLKDYRDAVLTSLRASPWYEPIAMEDLRSRGVDPLTTCLKEVSEAAGLVGIYGMAYGTTPPGKSLSFTELEYRQAQAAGIRCFAFLMDPEFGATKYRDVGTKDQELLEAFKALVTVRGWVKPFFTTPESLRALVVEALNQWRAEQEQALVDIELTALLRDADEDCRKDLEVKAPLGLLELEAECRDVRGEPKEEPEVSCLPLSRERLLDLFPARKRVLILGNPGAGKSVMLMRLAHELAAEIQGHPGPNSPVPVRFHLGSWTPRAPNLGKWLSDVLNDWYSCGREDVRRWIEAGALLPLLDGLDEVAPDDRLACVAAINQHLDNHKGGLVVTSRRQAYNDLRKEKPLKKVQAEVVLKPMGEAQREAYLARLGSGLETLRSALREQPVLRELASSPLMLRLMVKAYENAQPAALAGVIESAPEDRQGRLVEAYVTEMEKRPESQRYGTLRTRRALAWLSCAMNKHGMTRFEVERLQPTWLAGAAAPFAYAILSRGLGGGLMGGVLALAFWYQPWFLPVSGLAAGAAVGALDALPLWKATANGRAGGNALQAAVRVLTLGTAAFLVFVGLADALLPVRLYGIGFSVGLIFGLVFGLRPGDLRGEDTWIFKVLRKGGWSWRGGLLGMGLGAFSGLALALLAVLSQAEGGQGNKPKLELWLFLGVAMSVLGGLLGGITGGLVISFEEAQTRPNLGLRRITRDIRRVALRFAVIVAAALFTVGLGTTWWRDQTLSSAREANGLLNALRYSGLDILWMSARLGAATGLVIALGYGALDVLQHFCLRLLLSATGRFPWRWVRFLDHAANCGLLDKIEGHKTGDGKDGKVESGYEFLHEIVRKWFADLGLWREETV